jgi:hypothetical protein
MWVRVVLDGSEETAWTDLETLRLPERHLAMAPEPARASSVERDLSVARHPSSRREHRADGEGSATSSMRRVRDLSVVSDATVAPSGGRRRAPEVPVTASTGGRRRAPEEPTVAPSGGRRRAPETLPEMAAVSLTGGRRRAPEDSPVSPPGGRRRAPEDSGSTVPGPAALLGRHGAPAAAAVDPGRHRTADTGLFPAVSEAPPTIGVARQRAALASAVRGRALPSTLPSKPEAGAGGASRGNWSEPEGLESELLTRPMRLSDRIPHARRPRVDGSLRGV